MEKEGLFPDDDPNRQRARKRFFLPDLLLIISLNSSTAASSSGCPDSAIANSAKRKSSEDATRERGSLRSAPASHGFCETSEPSTPARTHRKSFERSGFSVLLAKQRWEETQRGVARSEVRSKRKGARERTLKSGSDGQGSCQTLLVGSAGTGAQLPGSASK